MRRSALLPLLATVLFGCPMDIHAQMAVAPRPLWPATAARSKLDLPAFAPGAVATVSLELLLDSLTLPAGYHVETTAGVRLFTPASGRIERGVDSTRALLPLTFAVPRDQAAGVVRVGRVRLKGADGRTSVRPLDIDVKPVRELQIQARVRSAVVPTNGHALIDAILTNTGNASDTVRISVGGAGLWHISAGAAPLIIAPHDSTNITLRVAAPLGFRGSSNIQLEATGRGSIVRTDVRVHVADVDAGSPRALFPATLFLGGSMHGGGEVAGEPGFAFESAGMIAPETHLRLRARRRGTSVTPSVFMPYLVGPRFLAELTRPGLSIAAGEVSSYSGGLGGGFYSGWGGRVAGSHAGYDAALLLARPNGGVSASGASDGLLARADAGRRFGPTRLGTTLLHFDGGSASPSDRYTALSATVDDVELGAHALDAEVGILAAADSSGRRAAGPAAHLGYRRSGQVVNWGARVRLIPDIPRATRTLSDLLELHGSVALPHGMLANGWTSYTASNANGTSVVARATSVGLTGDWRGTTLGVRLGNHRNQYAGEVLALDTERRSVALVAARGFGRLTLRGTAEFSMIEQMGGSADVQRYRMRGDWRGRASSIAASVNVRTGGMRPDEMRVDVHAAHRIGRVQLGFGAAAGVGDAGGFPVFRSDATMPVADMTTLIAGVEYNGWSTRDPWSVSFGIRQGIGLPAPYDAAAVNGTVFMDHNGDGIQQGGEPGLEGIRVVGGSSHATTDRDGDYRLPLSGPLSIRVDPSSLPEWLLVGGSQSAAPGEHIDMPLRRSARVDVTVYVDQNGNGLRDVGENGAVGALVELLEGDGGLRYGVTDARGVTAFVGMPTGSYALRIRPRSHPGEPSPASRDVTVQLEPGSNTVELGVAATRRRVVFGNASAGRVVDAAEVTVSEATAPTTATAPDKLSDDERAALEQPVHFAFDDSHLEEGTKAQLSEKSRLLDRHPLLRLCLVGHTDARGDASYNQRLGLERARAARDAMIARGVAAPRMGVASLGEEAPLRQGSDVADHAANRRVDVEIDRTAPAPLVCGRASGE